MDKTYKPEEIENRWYTEWEQRGYFRPGGTGTPYCIAIPPPNVTGNLHMGHAFQQTIMDALIRHHRMRGHNTLWQGGTDHAGIATQMVVERLLAAEGSDRLTLGREEFTRRVWQWKEHSGGNITRQQRRLGNSVDWSRERFTMDPELSEAVREVFVRLYREGLIYRGQRLVNWDPQLHTAISDLEVIAFDPFVTESAAAAIGVRLVSLPELFAMSDVVSIHAPLLPETQGLVTGAMVDAMKPGATLINTARGAIIREAEMIEVLRRRPDLTAFLDVVEKEPPPASSPLFDMANVVLTPHMAGSVGQECRRMGAFMSEELARFRAGKPLSWRITCEQCSRMA